MLAARAGHPRKDPRCASCSCRASPTPWALSHVVAAGAATGDAVATFDQVGVLVPRGRFDIEMYMSSLKLVGQAGGGRGPGYGRAVLSEGTRCSPACQHPHSACFRARCACCALRLRTSYSWPALPAAAAPNSACLFGCVVPSPTAPVPLFPPAGAGLPHPVRFHRARLPAAQDQRPAGGRPPRGRAVAGWAVAARPAYACGTTSSPSSCSSGVCAGCSRAVRTWSAHAWAPVAAPRAVPETPPPLCPLCRRWWSSPWTRPSARARPSTITSSARWVWLAPQAGDMAGRYALHLAPPVSWVGCTAPPHSVLLASPRPCLAHGPRSSPLTRRRRWSWTSVMRHWPPRTRRCAARRRQGRQPETLSGTPAAGLLRRPSARTRCHALTCLHTCWRGPLQCGGRLARRFHGPAYEVFAKVLRGLSGTKLTKPGTFRDAEGHGHAVRCSFKVGRPSASSRTAGML